MKILPRNWVLLALAGGLGYLAFTAHPESAKPRAVQPLLKSFDAGSVTELVLARGDTSTRLSRTADGWVVEDLFGAPAAERTIETLLQRLGGITDLDRLTDGASGGELPIDDYGLGEDEALRITARAEGGAVAGDVLIARAPGPGWPAFMRVPGSKEVVRSSFFEVPTEPRWWFARGPLIRLTGFQVKSLAVTGSAVVEPLRLSVPDGLVGEYVDDEGKKVQSVAVGRLLEGLRIVPRTVTGRAPDPLPAGLFTVQVTPLVGDPLEFRAVEFGDADARRPGKIFRVDTGITYAVDPGRLRAVVDLVAQVNATRGR